MVGWTHCHSYHLKKDVCTGLNVMIITLCSTVHALHTSGSDNASYYYTSLVSSHDSASHTHTHTHSYQVPTTGSYTQKGCMVMEKCCFKDTSKVSMRGLSTIKSYIIFNPAREILNTFVLVFLQKLKVTEKEFFSSVYKVKGACSVYSVI